jgi:hypothetical protein
VPIKQEASLIWQDESLISLELISFHCRIVHIPPRRSYHLSDTKKAVIFWRYSQWQNFCSFNAKCFDASQTNHTYDVKSFGHKIRVKRTGHRLPRTGNRKFIMWCNSISVSMGTNRKIV